jgi:hypothetical protein
MHAYLHRLVIHKNVRIASEGRQLLSLDNKRANVKPGDNKQHKINKHFLTIPKLVRQHIAINADLQPK